MANRTILLCLLILCISNYVTECKRWGGRSSSRSSSSGSSWGKSWGSSSSGSKWGGGSSYKPSSSSSGSGSSWFSSGSSGSSYKPSSSWNTGSSSSGSSWNSGISYPSSISGLSGSGTSYKYPTSSSGLSGSGGSGSFSYPSSSSGLSGSGSRNPSYPSSGGLSGNSYSPFGQSAIKPSYPASTGLSGYGNTGSASGTHSYPTGTGLSGSGSGNRYSSSSNSGTHNYPSGTGLSGSGNNYGYKPSSTYNTNSGYGSNSHHPPSYYANQPSSYSYHPTIYHYPQHVYVTQYRDSGSRYGDLLTGLTLYNMGRSHSHYHSDHYYYDDYYRNRPNRPQQQDIPKEEATCNLRIVEKGQLQLLKIPCEIVSTFTDGSHKVNNPNEIQMNQTVCTTNTTVIRNTNTTSPNVQANITLGNLTDAAMIPINGSNIMLTAQNGSEIIGLIPGLTQNNTVSSLDNIAVPNISAVNVSATNTTMIPTNSSNELKIVKEEKFNDGNKTTHVVRTISSTETTVNTTVCTTSTAATDPLRVTGPPVDPSGMECSVDIKTKEAYFRNKVDCNILIQYSKKPLTSPKKESSILPDRQKLQSWMKKPPWWMAMFIAV